ncbi:MAG: beta-lactamase family protein [Cellvibrionaceae bacterium]
MSLTLSLKTKPLLAVAVFFASIFISSVVFSKELTTATPETVGMSSATLENIDSKIRSYIDSGQLQGVVTMISRHGKVVYKNTAGKLNIETDAAMQEDSLFRIYSMTKPIVTAAAMQLYEQGKFQLTDPVSKYLPEFKNTKVFEDGQLVDQKQAMTIQHLMTHTSGIVYDFIGNSPVVKQYQAANLRAATTINDFSKKLAVLPLQEQPGTRWVYSFSIDILGRLIEVVSGEPLDQYLKNHIFSPLGMTDTFFEVPADKVNRFGTNHQFGPDGKLNIIDRPSDSPYTKKVTFFSGGGGLVSTADDYMRFCQALLNGGELHGKRILGRKTIEYMVRDHLPGILSNAGVVTNGTGAVPNRVGFGFGLGFAITTDPEAAGTISSAGEYYWSGVAGTIFWIDPAEDLIVISMIQQRGSRVPLRNTLKAITYGSILRD